MMFLRLMGRKFSIHQRALLLRRVPVRTVTNAQQTVVEENGCDTSLVRAHLCLSFNFRIATSNEQAQIVITCILIGEFYFFMGKYASREARKQKKMLQTKSGTGDLIVKLLFLKANFTIHSEFDGDSSWRHNPGILCKNVNRLLLQIYGEHG